MLAYVAQIAVGLQLPSWLFFSITATGAAATLTTIFLAARGVLTAEEAAMLAAKKQRAALQDLLVPLVGILGEIVATSTKKERQPLQQQMKQAIITMAATTIGPPAASRACLLEVVANSPRELKCLNNLFAGRVEEPVTPFVEGTERGNRWLAMMDRRSSVFVHDVADLDVAFQSDRENYQTYTATAVYAGGAERFGVLAVDSLRPGDLEQADITLLEVLARMLGAALGVGSRK